jgi:paraquat-inducible protein A
MISKWSMADVFVVGVFLSFLATRSNKDINAWLHDGFYFFLAYCLISILATQIMDIEEN